MRKNILVSAVASIALAGSLYANTTGPGSSTITAGSDINGTVHSQKLTAEITLSASDSNVTDANGAASANWNNFITYRNNIAIGNGNLITVKVNNGGIVSNDANKLWLVDANSTAEQNATGAPVVAKMTDFVKSGNKYTQMTFKFISNVDSQHDMVLVNKFDQNASLVTSYGADYGLGARTSALGLIVNAGLACADNVTLEVINSKDQSGDFFNQPNTAGASDTGVTVAKGVYIKLGVDGDDAASGASAYDNASYGTNDCPTFSCAISINDEEKAFGSSSSANASVCPTCTPATTTTQDLTCQGSFLMKYNNSTLIPGGGVTLSAINVTTAADIAIPFVSSVKGELNNNAAQDSLTISGQTASGSLTTGLIAANDNKVELTYTVDGTTVIEPTVFDLGVKVNGTADVDTISGFMKFTEQGTPLTVAYLSANPSYRSFVRVTSTKPATIQAVLTTEDGAQSARFDYSGGALTGTNGGALVVEAATLLADAQAAGFTGAGLRFNATLYVKTTGTVDAVAYQLDAASNSTRYLPVGGATGGGKN